MADPFIAEIRIFPFNFPPEAWAWCDGQLLPITQNAALFSVLGNIYGGDGVSDFALPDFRGRVPMHPGQSSGLSFHDLGETGGSEMVTLTVPEIAPHFHGLRASNSLGDSATPAGHTLARLVNVYQQNVSQSLADMAVEALSPTGGGAPHNNLQPYLTLYFCIALQGALP